MVQEDRPLAFTRFNFVPNIVTRYFTVGYFYAQRTYMGIAESASSTVQYIYRQDQGPFLGFNISLLGGVIKFGLTGFYLWRKELNETSPADQVITIEDNMFNKGQGYFGIAGFRFTYPSDWLPTLSAAYQNILDGDFENYGTDPVSPYPTNLTVGISLSPQVGKQVRLHLEANYVDALEKDDRVEDIDRLEVGMELDYDRRSFLRLGLLDGYLSGGFGFITKHLTVNFSTYGVLATIAPGQVQEDRRFVISFSYGI
jgi:hypothetical protein